MGWGGSFGGGWRKLEGGDGSFRGPTGEAFVGQWRGGAVGKGGWLCYSTKSDGVLEDLDDRGLFRCLCGLVVSVRSDWG